ncbi:cobalt ABC transporter permease [Sporanaerobium hydrogeniformans]|uniref:Cobalt ABC transporter permease n=1 Tax=Sporanaerobium hydrogeniformans TaxID=3072179 RepID=A0AC61DAD1_9FIRM|nr:energy-coupling factor transporter transmembrane component T [Sporanaerobium hydrogeniformans]PHV69532.1 cobalt ABC transporter permease [Sporanaerobium hydrogeniformans]
MWREKLSIKKDNAIAALYPSAKFLIVCLYSFCSLIIGTIKIEGYPFFLIPWFLIVPILCAASGVWKNFIKAFNKVLFIAVIIFVVQSLFVPSETIIWQIGFIKVYEAGLQSAIVLSFSIMNIAGMFIWMFQTTENKEISRALEDSGMNYKVAYVFISTLQMIEVLGKSSKTIMNAQQARGVETEGNIFIRSKAFFPSMVPLILGAITNTEERVLTLESKGFDVKCKKTHLFEIEKSGKEKLAAVIAILITTLVIIGRVLAWVL